MKILHVTDTHGTMKSPIGRKDIYYLSFLNKLRELGDVIKIHDIDIVLHTGDLFNGPHVSDQFAGLVSEEFKKWNIPIYIVPGNHDIEGYSIKTLGQTKLGLLAKAGVVTILDRSNPVVLQDKWAKIAISGQEYYMDIDTGLKGDFEMQQEYGDFNILCIHGYIADKPQFNRQYTLASTIKTDADVILSGHYHQSFKYENEQTGVSIYNPGSMMRIDRTQYNKTHIPQYGILDIDVQEDAVFFDYDFHKFSCVLNAEEALDFEGKEEADNMEISLQNFKESLSEATEVNNLSYDFETALSSILSQSDDKEVIDMSQSILEEYEDKNADMFELKKGYVCSTYPVYISSVSIKNFQSHVNTEIVFDEHGMNVIIGDINQGKTAILRAIMWVVDNLPSGNSFITTGQDECEVAIRYSDGQEITRGRTTESAGYYKIKYFNSDHVLCEETFKGFHNEVPVQIQNIHQMPIIQVTKDYVTHLNTMLQLDGPFLITLSPSAKAQIIGRITGTQVADDCIKELRARILNNKKLIKIKEEDLAKLVEDKKGLDDPQKYVIAENIVNDIISANTRMSIMQESYNNTVESIRDIDGQINEINSQVAIANAVNCFKEFIDIADDMCSKTTSFGSVYDEYVDLHGEIIDTSKQEGVLKQISSMLVEMLGRIEEPYEKYNKMIQANSEYKKILPSIAKAKSSASFLSSIVDEFSEMHEKINGIYLKASYGNEAYDYYLRASKGIDIAMDEEKALHNDLNKYNAQYSEIVDKIISAGICPCCQQKITDKSKQHVLNYIGA